MNEQAGKSTGQAGLVLTFVVSSLILAVLLVAVTEGIVAAHGTPYRLPLLLGGGAGWLVNLLALPFGLMLGRLPIAGPGVKDGAFWFLWGAGFMARLVGVSVSAFALNWFFHGKELPTLMALMAVFLPGLFVESIWLGKRFFALDKK